MDIPFYSMFSGGLPRDIMHDVLEGVAPLEMSLLLQSIILAKQLLTVEEYNFRLLHFDYDYTEISRPQPLGAHHILAEGKPLKLSAAQALLLVRILPLLIGDVVPRDDQNWNCFLLLCKIVDIIVCPWSSIDVCAVLKGLIKDHHQLFVSIYRDTAVIPKCNFVLHYPDQILRIGPMVRSWNMRNEAKLNLFKQTVHLGNFKNISLSVAHRHQRLLCYELSSSRLCESPTECGPCNLPLSLESEPQHLQDSLLQSIPDAHHDTKIARPTWVKQCGVTIKNGAYLITGSDNFYPVFSEVITVFFVLDIVILELSRYTVDYFDDHFNAYVVLPSTQRSFIRFDRLRDHSILHAHKKGSNVFIYLKQYVQSW